MTRLALIISLAGLSPWLARADPTFDLEARKRALPWIWETPQRHSPPAVAGEEPVSDIDAFLLARLQADGLAPAPPADDLTWLRRVTFALTGLPPEPAGIQAFLNDSSPNRRDLVVDAQFSSPHFGERWARHWMDLMRYAESRGHEEDFVIANAWRYRDYLVRALNADVPYDRFVAKHVAGDILSPRLDPVTGANESVLATGWAFLGEENHSPVDIRLDECERIDNKIDVLTKTFLGLTVACARCHDHKFDAISQRDYHALAGIFLGSPYRQVRFETMVPHARAAERLESLRGEHLPVLLRTLASQARAGAESVAASLKAARRRLRGEADVSGSDPERVTRWADHLKLAAGDPRHPMHQLAQLATATDAAPSAVATSVPPAEAGFTPPPDAQVIADFTVPGRTPWKVDGPTFGVRPLQSGEVALDGPERPVARVLQAGAAVRDPFWNRLSLTPGTEMDSGSLAAAARAGKSLLTPKVTLKSGRLHYLMRGHATVYAGVDSHLMIAGPLHGALVASFDTSGQTSWVTHDLSAYAGHRAHLEFAPQGDSPLEILVVVDAKDPPAWHPEAPWQPRAAAGTWEAMCEALQAETLIVLDSLASGQRGLSPSLATLAHWMVQHPELIGVSQAALTRAAEPLFRAREDMAREMRWDSPTAVSFADGTGVDDPVLARGRPSNPGPAVARGLPAAFGQPRIDSRDTSGRAQLAGQMTDPSNPLIARVLVNRVWHHLFGRGLVASVDNFGLLGDRPSHPELLDHLAWQFIHEDHWSLKRLIRRLVLTRAFARSSRPSDSQAEERDPSNQLLHRMPVRRLEGEAIRDALLAVSGRLDRTLGGPPIPPHLTEFTVGRGSPATSGPLDGAGRRSVYLAARRNFLPTLMLTFDLPTPFSTVGRRNVTNVPAQSLALMNDPMIREQATLWSARLLRELPDTSDTARVAWLFQTGFGRPPSEAESAATVAALAELRSLHAGAGEPFVWSELCHALVGTNDFFHLK